MKHNFIKSVLVLALGLISMSAMAVDWSSIAFLGDGAQGGALSNKYKVNASGINVVNIQHPGFASEDGIYIGFPDAAFNAVVDEDDTELTFDKDGAGICLHISNFYKQETSVIVKNNDTERWSFDIYYADGINFVSTPSEYCEYEGPETVKDGNYVALTWSTNRSGNVVITMSNGTGATSCSFRNGGFEGGIDAFVVSTDNFATSEPASNYFTFEKVYSGNVATLVRIAPLPAGAKIKHVGQPGNLHAFAWTVNGSDAWCWPDFIYTYGANCPVVEDSEAPTNFTATVKGSSYTSVTLTLSATDNVSNKIYYIITDNYGGRYETNAPSGNEIDYVIKGLALNTAYTFHVVASDARENGNVTANMIDLQATTLAGEDPATYFGIQTGVATSAYIDGVQTTDVPYEIYYSITRNSDFTLTCNAFLAGEYAHANGLANGSVGYRGSTDWADFTKNADGTRIRQTSKDTYDSYEGQGITCMFHFPAQEALINPYFEGYVVGAASDPYTRPLTVGDFGTLCVPFNATVAGAELYTVAGLIKSGETITGVALDAAATAQAGVPYIIKATASNLSVTYTAVAAFEETTGNFGTEPLAVPAGNYIVYENELHSVAEGVATIDQNKAYFDLTALDEVPAAAPGRIVMPIDGNPVATGVEQTLSSSPLKGECVKALVNGQLVIVRNGAIFNLNGMLVK